MTGEIDLEAEEQEGDDEKGEFNAKTEMVVVVMWWRGGSEMISRPDTAYSCQEKIA